MSGTVPPNNIKDLPATKNSSRGSLRKVEGVVLPNQMEGTRYFEKELEQNNGTNKDYPVMGDGGRIRNKEENNLLDDENDQGGVCSDRITAPSLDCGQTSNGRKPLDRDTGHSGGTSAIFRDRIGRTRNFNTH